MGKTSRSFAGMIQYGVAVNDHIYEFDNPEEAQDFLWLNKSGALVTRTVTPWVIKGSGG